MSSVDEILDLIFADQSLANLINTGSFAYDPFTSAQEKSDINLIRMALQSTPYTPYPSVSSAAMGATHGMGINVSSGAHSRPLEQRPFSYYPAHPSTMHSLLPHQPAERPHLVPQRAFAMHQPRPVRQDSLQVPEQTMRQSHSPALSDVSDIENEESGLGSESSTPENSSLHVSLQQQAIGDGIDLNCHNEASLNKRRRHGLGEAGNFVCLVPGCGKRYTSTGGIRYHLRNATHEGLTHTAESRKQLTEAQMRDRISSYRVAFKNLNFPAEASGSPASSESTHQEGVEADMATAQESVQERKSTSKAVSRKRRSREEDDDEEWSNSTSAHGSRSRPKLSQVQVSSIRKSSGDGI